MYNLRKRKIDLEDLENLENLQDLKDAKIIKIDEFDPDQFEENLENLEDEEDSLNDLNSLESESLIDVMRKKFPNANIQDLRYHLDKILNNDLNDAELNKLRILRDIIKKEEPTVNKIIQADIPEFEKAKALELYDVLVSFNPSSFEYYKQKNFLNHFINKSCNLSDEINQKISSAYLEIDKSNPTIDKIINARLNQNDKNKALELYKALIETEMYTESWFNLRSQIQHIIDHQYKSDQELVEIQLQELIIKNEPNNNVSLKKKIFQLEADDKIKKIIFEMYEDMISRNKSDSSDSLKEKINWALKLPYNKHIELQVNDPGEHCIKIYDYLNNNLYGMNSAKEKIIQMINNRIKSKNFHTILALKGSPGVGKTKLAKVLADAVNLPIEKISLGGVFDSTIFKGSDSVWTGAAPSLLLQSIAKLKVNNGIILLDEIDKLGMSDKGLEVQNALLHILDRTQNKEFQDNFLSEFNHDISNIWFIVTLNDENKLSPLLKDRLHIIELPSYSIDEMIIIMQKHTFPEICVNAGLNAKDITITENAAKKIIFSLKHNKVMKGMRSVEHVIAEIVSRLSLLKTLKGKSNNNIMKLSFSAKDFEQFPYIITVENLEKLWSNNDKEILSYFS